MNRRWTKASAGLELFVAAAFWGFGFIATVWVLRETGAAHLTFLRFAIAAPVILPFLFSREARRLIRSYVVPAFYPSVLLTVMLILQSWGLLYTTATKSGFITTLYVVFVPLMEAMFSRRRVPEFLWLCVLLSLVGTAMIVNLGLDSLNRGDALTGLAAILAGLQIMEIGRLTSKIERPFLFNCVQTLWAMLLSAPFAFWPGSRWVPITDVPHWPWLALIGLASLGYGSTVIAFALQLRAQVRLSPTVASLIFLLESPIGVGFAMLLLGERLTSSEFIGAILILVSAIAAVTR